MERHASTSRIPGMDVNRESLLEQQKNSVWKQFLLTNEVIIHSGLVRKTKGLSKKKRQLILTDIPRLFYVDPDKMLLKGEVPWSKDLRVMVKDNRRFQIVTPNRIYLMEDFSNCAKTWDSVISELVSPSK